MGCTRCPAAVYFKWYQVFTEHLLSFVSLAQDQYSCGTKYFDVEKYYRVHLVAHLHGKEENSHQCPSPATTYPQTYLITTDSSITCIPLYGIHVFFLIYTLWFLTIGIAGQSYIRCLENPKGESEHKSKTKKAQSLIASLQPLARENYILIR